MNLDWIVSIAAGLVVLVACLKFVNLKVDSGYQIRYECPKCAGNDYFMSTRNVTKGIGGIYGNRGGTKQFPVCRKCDEIMSRQYFSEE
jgi:hypothetical protein